MNAILRFYIWFHYTHFLPPFLCPTCRILIGQIHRSQMSIVCWIIDTLHEATQITLSRPKKWEYEQRIV